MNTSPSESFTKEVIGEAFLVLLNEKSYDDIKVVEIVNKAGVSRSTFYRFFDKSSKKEILFEYILNLWKKYYEESKYKSNIEESILTLMNFNYDYKDIILVLNKAGLTHIIYNLIFNMLDDDSLKTDEKIIISSLAGSIYGLVNYWIENDFNKTPKEIIEVFLKLQRNKEINYEKDKRS